jgi:hypothetical protein
MTATARCGHGEGSVYRDAANGTRVGAISLGWRPDASRIRRQVTGRTKTEVRDKLKELQAEADTGLKTSASYTVAKAVDDWAKAAEQLMTLANCTVIARRSSASPSANRDGAIDAVAASWTAFGAWEDCFVQLGPVLADRD